MNAVVFLNGRSKQSHEELEHVMRFLIRCLLPGFVFQDCHSLGMTRLHFPTTSRGNHRCFDVSASTWTPHRYLPEPRCSARCTCTHLPLPSSPAPQQRVEMIYLITLGSAWLFHPSAFWVFVCLFVFYQPCEVITPNLETEAQVEQYPKPLDLASCRGHVKFGLLTSNQRSVHFLFVLS